MKIMRAAALIIILQLHYSKYFKTMAVPAGDHAQAWPAIDDYYNYY